MDEERTYTIEEIEKESGFDRRTIAYYVQQGLLPKVGRRGPKTRYPRLFLDRLRFIKQLQDLQDTGKIAPITLGGIKVILEKLPHEVVTDLVLGERGISALGLPAGVATMAESNMFGHQVDGLSSDEDVEPDMAPPEMAAMIRGRTESILGSGPLSRLRRRPSQDDELPDLLVRLSEEARSADEGSGQAGWSTVEVTGDFLLTVRGRSRRARKLVERVAKILRLLMNPDTR